jgi:hypothetical protein
VILKGTYQPVINADNVNVLGGSVHNLYKENKEILVVASVETSLELNAEKLRIYGHYAR